MVGVAMCAAWATACGFTPLAASAPDLSHAEQAIGHPVELAAGQIRSLDHPAFEHAAAEHAFWSPLALLEDGGAGIFFLEPYDPERIPVLFIHGIGGSPRDFRHMIESLDRSRFQAWVFNYPSGFRLEGVVTLLHKILAKLEQRHQVDTLFVTAHSLGGLISLGYTKSARAKGEHVKLLVTFSSPWEGVPWAAIGARRMPFPVPSWHDLAPGSEFLTSLRTPARQEEHPPPHYVFFGFHRSASLINTESSDGAISVSSQLPQWIQDQAESYWGYDVTHAGMLSDGAVLERYNAVLEATANRLRTIRSASTCP